MSALPETFATIYWEDGRHVLSCGIAKLLGYLPGAGTGRGGPHRRGLGTNLRIKPPRKVQAREERNVSNMTDAQDPVVLLAMPWSFQLQELIKSLSYLKKKKNAR